MAALAGREHPVPLAFDVRTVGVKPGLEPGILQHALARRDLARDRDPDPHGDDTQIDDDSHGKHLLSRRVDHDGWSGPNDRPFPAPTDSGIQVLQRHRGNGTLAA